MDISFCELSKAFLKSLKQDISEEEINTIIEKNLIPIFSSSFLHLFPSIFMDKLRGERIVEYLSSKINEIKRKIGRLKKNEGALEQQLRDAEEGVDVSALSGSLVKIKENIKNNEEKKESISLLKIKLANIEKKMRNNRIGSLDAQLTFLEDFFNKGYLTLLLGFFKENNDSSCESIILSFEETEWKSEAPSIEYACQLFDVTIESEEDARTVLSERIQLFYIAKGLLETLDKDFLQNNFINCLEVAFHVIKEWRYSRKSTYIASQEALCALKFTLRQFENSELKNIYVLLKKALDSMLASNKEEAKASGCAEEKIDFSDTEESKEAFKSLCKKNKFTRPLLNILIYLSRGDFESAKGVKMTFACVACFRRIIEENEDRKYDNYKHRLLFPADGLKKKLSGSLPMVLKK